MINMFKKILFIIIIVIVVMLAGSFFYFLIQISGSASASVEEVIFNVKKGVALIKIFLRKYQFGVLK